MTSLELKIPPLFLVVLTAVLMWLVARATPNRALDGWNAGGALWIAIVLAVAGVLLVLEGGRVFRKAGTTFTPVKPGKASSIVTTGIYGITRNPMYVGMTLVLCGWAVFLGNIMALALVPVFTGYIARFQIVPEERILLQKFGDEYADYMQKVRRWF